jgi:hypothetical protein
VKGFRILLSGMVAGHPYQGGATWAVLQYLLGLRNLGHHVTFVEPVAPSALGPVGTSLAESENAEYFHAVMERYGCRETAALLLADTHETVGCSYAALRQAAADADLLINISGLLTDEVLCGAVPTRVYLDLDPAFNQLWHAVQGIDRNFGGHTHFVTIGQAIGRPECVIPDCGRTWITTWQPVVLEEWTVSTTLAHDALTTVGNWRAYGSVEHDGVFYGQKAHALRELFSLPTRTTERFLLALAIHADEPKDLASLVENRWQLCDPAHVAGAPWDYQAFVGGSKAEFGIAKSGYVVSKCGWFSDRTVCYLASGRPAIAQETGFSSFLPTGEGLFAFQTIDDVLAGIESLNSDYERHRRAARALAEDVFDSRKVLSALLQRVNGVT